MQKSLWEKFFLFSIEEPISFGLGCFKTTDNSMFDKTYSKALYGLHGSGEILVARHLWLNFGHISPSDALNTGDLVLMKDPRDPEDVSEEERAEFAGRLLARRIGALPGETIVSASDSDNAVDLAANQVWVMADNYEAGESDTILPPDSRTFGPVDATKHIFGRVVYSIRSAVDHGPILNPSPRSQAADRSSATALDDHVVVQDFLNIYNR